MAFFRDLAALLWFSGFRRLFAVRLLSQGSDGIFQVALVSTVLFSRASPHCGCHRGCLRDDPAPLHRARAVRRGLSRPV